MPYAAEVLRAARSDDMPEDATTRFQRDVERVRRHLEREARTGIYRNLHIATPRDWGK